MPQPLGPRTTIERPSAKRLNTVLIIGGAVAGFVVLGCAGFVALLLAPRATGTRLEALADVALESSIADVPGGPTWVADPQLVAQLGPEAKFGNYAMRVPDGYSSGGWQLDNSGLSPPETRTADRGWQSPILPGPAFAIIRAEVREVPAAINGEEHFERRLFEELKKLRHEYGIRNMHSEAGRVGGKRTVRVTYSASTRRDSHDCMKIFRFEGNRLLVFTLVCPGGDRQLFRLLEAALLTARESNPG